VEILYFSDKSILAFQSYMRKYKNKIMFQKVTTGKDFISYMS